MNPAAGMLDYAAAPALDVPLRFMLGAAVFGVTSGVLLVFFPAALSSRWTPEAFALTHLVAVGFVFSVIFGALFQILPVIAGVAVPGGRALAGIMHVALTLGAAVLSWGLGAGEAGLIHAGATLLFVAVAVFVLVVALALSRSRISLDTQRDLRIALVGIGIAVLLGATLAMVLSRGLALPFGTLLELHVGWALLGAAGMLLAATSWIVVPMFQITPAYPRAMTRGWGPAVFVALVMWSGAVVLDAGVASVLQPLPLLLATIFAVSTLALQRRSRRSASDMTTRAFRLAMICFVAGIGCVLAAHHLGGDVWAVAAGVLILYGGFTGAIQGMLYKIVPFLCWLDLSQSGRRAPNMRKLQPDRPIALQARVHTGALLAVLVAVVVHEAWLARLAGVAVAADFGWLLWNMVGVLRAHRVATGSVLARKD